MKNILNSSNAHLNVEGNFKSIFSNYSHRALHIISGADTKSDESCETKMHFAERIKTYIQFYNHFLSQKSFFCTKALAHVIVMGFCLK